MRGFVGLLILIVESLLAAVCFYWLAKPFLEDKKRAFCVGTVYFLALLILYTMPLQFDGFLADSIGSLAGFLVMCGLERRNYRQKTFLAVTFFSLRCFALAMVKILYDKLYSFSEHTTYDLNLRFELYVFVCMLYLAMEFAFMSAAVFCILKSYTYKKAEMSGKELLMLSAPSFMGAVGLKSMWYYRNFFIAQTGKVSNIYDMLLLLYYVVAIAVIVAVIVLYQSMKAGQEEKLQNELLAAQIENTEKHIEQVENLYQDIRSMKHDMANHIFTLERLYAGNKEEAKAYSKQLRDALSKAAGRIKSGNPVTDVILQEMQYQAEQRKIDFKADFHYPAGSKVNAFDLSVALHNALQNALEYSDKNSRSSATVISVVSYRRNNAYMIEVNNSFTGSLRWDAESGLPMTSKEKRKESKADKSHGYGIANIRRVAEKYAGDIAIDVKDGMFCLSVLLMLEE